MRKKLSKVIVEIMILKVRLKKFAVSVAKVAIIIVCSLCLLRCVRALSFLLLMLLSFAVAVLLFCQLAMSTSDFQCLLVMLRFVEKKIKCISAFLSTIFLYFFGFC